MTSDVQKQSIGTAGITAKTFGFIRHFLSKCRSVRVPVVQQMQTVECGTACLTMIARYYGKKVTLSEVRTFCDAGNGGVSALTLTKAGRALGFNVKAFAVEDFENFRLLRFPLIAHWSFNHFVVIEKFSNRRIRIVDPAIGRRTISLNEFSQNLTGIVVSLAPGETFTVASAPQESFWSKYFQRLSRDKSILRLFLQTLLVSLLLLGAGLIQPVFTKIVIDSVLPQKSGSLLNSLGIGIGLLLLTQASLVYLRSRALIYLRGKIDIRLAFDFFTHLLKLPFRFFQLRSSGDLLMRLGSLSVLRETLTSQTVSVLLDGLLVVVYLMILMFVSFETAIAVVFLAAIQGVVLLFTHSRNRSLTQAELTARSEEQGYLVEALKSIMIIKASSSEDNSLRQWKKLFYDQLNASIDRSVLIAKVDTIVTTLRFLAPLMILWLNATRVLSGDMSIGTAIAITGLASSTLFPVASLFSTGQQLQSVVAHLDRLKDVLEEKQEVVSADLLEKPLSGNVEAKDINFRYTRESPLVLKDINFKIKSGQKIAIVGSTASGKSTLVSLLLGLNKLTDGEILFDGLSSHEINPECIRKQIGVVLQDPHIFGGTIRENLCMGELDVEYEQIIRAATLAQIHEDISKMPMAYESIIGEGGSSLSGGQRQRLALARALLRDPAILILDEATSHLDVETEAQVDKNLSGIECTRFVIAHRLSTIHNADLILVIESGSIQEQGTHTDLLAKDGIYASFISKQRNLCD